MKSTIYLNPDSWDLEIDASGNIAMASSPYAQAQDVACACMLWKGEAAYDTTRGIDYQSSVLGQMPAPSILQGWFQTEAETVPGVKSAMVILQHDRETRKLSGQIQLSLEDGSTTNVNI